MFVTTPVLAQSANSDQLQHQINALKKQLQALQNQVTETTQRANSAQYNAQPPEIAAERSDGPL
jgi:hypothetical protein